MATRGPAAGVNANAGEEVACCIDTDLELVPQSLTLASSVSKIARMWKLKKGACDKQHQKLRQYMSPSLMKTALFTSQCSGSTSKLSQ